MGALPSRVTGSKSIYPLGHLSRAEPLPVMFNSVTLSSSVLQDAAVCHSLGFWGRGRSLYVVAGLNSVQPNL